jgi:hypothetical protein
MSNKQKTLSGLEIQPVQRLGRDTNSVFVVVTGPTRAVHLVP